MHELMFYFNVDFVLTKGDLFQNETEKLSENSEYKKGTIESELLSIGFNKTGKSTLILKLNMVNVDDYFTFLNQ